MFKTIRSRRGKISWPLAVLGTLGIAGTAVVVPQMSFDSAKSKNSIVSVQSIDSGVLSFELDSIYPVNLGVEVAPTFRHQVRWWSRKRTKANLPLVPYKTIH